MRLWQAVQGSLELRRRLRAVEREVRDLDRELATLALPVPQGDRALRQGPWRILVAVDDMQQSVRAAEAAATLAQASGGSVLVFHVREIDRVLASAPPETREAAESCVHRYVERLRDQGVQAEGAYCTDWRGREARDIAEAAGRTRADIVVVGTRGCSKVASLLAGSVAQETVRRAHCPVLVVR